MAGLLTVVAVACSLNRPAHSEDPPPEPAGHVLLYTDNTPGAVVWAHADLWAANGQGYEVQIVTNVEAFKSAIPSRNWRYVIVAEKHVEGAPTYSSELAAYVDSGGWAFIHRWREDPANPPPSNQIVNAPGVSHIWLNGFTVWGYYLSKLDSERAAGSSSGYATKSFDNVEVHASSVVFPLGMVALEPSVQSGAAMATPEPATCEGALKEQRRLITADFIIRSERCDSTYGPDPAGNPPNPGNPQKHETCMLNAANAMRDMVRIAVEDYFVCVDKRSPPVQ